MSLFTNDLDTVQECFGWGIMMLFDACFMGVLAIGKMWRMSPTMTLLSLIPMLFLMAAATVLGRYMMKKWDIRQEAFSRLTDFAQESFTGLAVIKAFVKEGKELWAFKKLNIENEKANMPMATFEGSKCDHVSTAIDFNKKVDSERNPLFVI